MTVPFLDLKAQYQSIKGEIDSAMQSVVDSCAFSGGVFVERFEKEFAAYCGTRHCVAVGSGTEALWFILLALGIHEGDEVITVPNTFIATAEAVSYCQARPVFVDADEKLLTMDPGQLRKRVGKATRAILPVHLYGQTADMDPILEIAREHGIPVIEDACQAHGAAYRGRKAGSLGTAAAFSFYPGKNLGAYGEAGAVATNDEELAGKIRMLRDHGQRARYYHSVVGMNGRMDGLQGAVLSVKLKHLDDWNAARIRNAAEYDRLLAGIDGVRPPGRAGYAYHIYHIYCARVPKRDQLLQRLKERGITCGIHYPVPITRQDAYSHLGIPPSAYPVSERSAEQGLSLPMYPELTRDSIQYVADAIRQALAELR